MAALARALAPTAVQHEEELIDLADQVQSRWTSERDDSYSDDDRNDHIAATATVVEQMLALPAQGLAGLRAKAMGAAWCAGRPGDLQSEQPEDLYGKVLHSIACDLLALPTAEVLAFPQPVETSAPKASDLTRAAADFIACKAQAEEAYGRLSKASDAAEALYPEVPQLIRDWQHPDRPLNRVRLEQLDKNAAQVTWPKPEGSPRVAAFDRWVAQKAIIDASFGVPGLDDAWETARDAEDAAADRVVAIRPSSVQEAVMKYAVLLASFGSADREEIISPTVFFAFLNDLEHVARSTAS